MTTLLYLAQPLSLNEGAAAAALARTIANAGMPLVLGWGGTEPPAPEAGMEVVALPPAGGLAPGSRWILDPDGQPVDHAWKKRRAAATLALAARARPDLLLLDGPMLASGAFRFELRPLLEIQARRTPRPLTAAWSPEGPLPMVEGQPLPDRVLTDADPERVVAALADMGRILKQ